MTRRYNNRTKSILLFTILTLLPLGSGAITDRLVNKVKIFDQVNSDEQRRMAPSLLEEFGAKKLTIDRLTTNSNTPIDTIRTEVWLQNALHLFNLGDYTLSYEYLTKAHHNLEKGRNYRQEIILYSLLSYMMYTINDLPKALEYGSKCLSLEKESAVDSRILLVINNMASMYNDNGYSKEAMPYIQEGLKMCTKMKDTYAVARFYSTTGEVYYSLGNVEESNKYLSKAYDLVRNNPDMRHSQLIYLAIANIKVKAHKTEEALQYIEQGLPIAKAAGDEQTVNELLMEKGRALLQKGLNNMAAYNLEQAATYFHQTNNLRQEQLAELELFYAFRYELPERASEHLFRAYQLKDSIDQNLRELKISQYSVFYKNKKLEEQNMQVRQQRITTIAISSALVFLLLLILVYLAYKSKMRSNMLRINKEQNEMKERFFTNITHEFRTPLTIIQMAAQTIQNEQDGEMSSAHKHASVILNQEQALLSLINNMLDIAKLKSLESEKQQWKKGDLVEYIRMLLDSFSLIAKHKDITINYAPKEEHIKADFVPKEMQSIIVNLVANALKYSPDHTTITVSTELADNDQVKISVADQGIGMTPEQAEHAFDAFFQADQAGNSLSTGIGLSLVKSCVEAMNGTIHLETAPNEGSTFTILMPRLCGEENVEEVNLETTESKLEPEEDEQEQSENEARNGDDKRPLILIVEDSAAVAHYTASMLEDKYQTVTAADGKEGLEKATELVPDLIISDVMMPVMDGYTLCETVRNSDLLGHIPVILVTARITDEDRIRGLKAGADDYMTKPFNREVLSIRVEKLLEQRSMLRKKYAQAFHDDTEMEMEWSEPDRRFLDDVYKHIEKLTKEKNINVNTLADSMCISARQLQRRVTAVTGETPLTLITHVRMKLAKKLLLQGSTVAYTAMECGFEDPSNFTRTFKKSVGMTPSMWLKKYQHN